MKTPRTLALSLIATLILAGAALAGNTQDEVTRLEVAKDRLANGAQSVKPNQAYRMRSEADELQKLIDEVESGKKLDPSEVDRAIRRSYRGF